jgi:mitochondrial chaperone BCS1
MGLLLHGSPGTGKTTLAYSLALHLGYNLVLCSPSSVRMGLYMEKCVYLFDDVDRTITDPDAEDGKKRMVGQTVAGMLSALDGTACPGRAVVVMTCNHLDLLDPALVRPGRIDWSHRFEPPTRVMVEFLMSRFFGAPVGLPAFEPSRPMSFYQACCLKHQQDPAAAASEACSADTFGVVRGEPCMN